MGRRGSGPYHRENWPVAFTHWLGHFSAGMDDDFDLVIERSATKSLKWKRYGKDVLPLWVADMDFRAPAPAREVLREAVMHGIFGYELPSKELAETVASRMGRLYQWKVSPEWVLATPGIVAGFHTAARACCSPGQGVLVQPPVYPPFLSVAKHTGTIGQHAPLRLIREAQRLRYEIDWAAFDSALNSNQSRTAMFLLCHPHNPTGQVFRRDELERFAEICLRDQILICSDEIHSELLLGGSRHLPIASLAPEIASRTITLMSPSKTFNLVGLFCGFAIIPDKSLRRRYREVLEASALHVNSLGLAAAQKALSGECDEWLERLRTYLTANRDYLLDFIARELPGVAVTVPDATYLAWLDFSAWRRERQIEDEPYSFLLTRARVALNPGAEFGAGGENCARLNFGCPRATLQEALHRIKAALGS